MTVRPKILPDDCMFDDCMMIALQHAPLENISKLDQQIPIFLNVKN